MTRLERAIAAIGSDREATAFLSALFTAQEIKQLRRRWQAFELSLGGRTQRDVAKKLDISVTTAGRAAREAKKHSHIIRILIGRIAPS